MPPPHDFSNQIKLLISIFQVKSGKLTFLISVRGGCIERWRPFFSTVLVFLALTSEPFVRFWFRQNDFSGQWTSFAFQISYFTLSLATVLSQNGFQVENNLWLKRLNELTNLQSDENIIVRNQTVCTILPICIRFFFQISYKTDASSKRLWIYPGVYRVDSILNQMWVCSYTC